jgi:excisionase family DNA binding protein
MVAASTPYLLTREDAARSLAISITYLDRLTRAGEIPVVRIGNGRAKRFAPADLQEWAQRRRAESLRASNGGRELVAIEEAKAT